jgi:transcriptional regulator with XRE-family HTH domain
MKSPLNSELLSSMIKSKRQSKGLRETAKEIDIGLATLSRVEQGNLPDVETFIKLCNWLGVSTDIFINDDAPKEVETSEKDTLIFQLRSSGQLDKATVDAIITLVELAYDRKTIQEA